MRHPLQLACPWLQPVAAARAAGGDCAGCSAACCPGTGSAPADVYDERYLANVTCVPVCGLVYSADLERRQSNI
jgi:hypothetical protein